MPATVSDAPALRRKAPRTARRDGHINLQHRNGLITAYHFARRAFVGGSLIGQSEGTTRSAAPGLLCATGVSCLAQSSRPDPTDTPSALNQAVTPNTIATTIYTSGWAHTVRPPREFTSYLDAPAALM